MIVKELRARGLAKRVLILVPSWPGPSVAVRVEDEVQRDFRNLRQEHASIPQIKRDQESMDGLCLCYHFAVVGILESGASRGDSCRRLGFDHCRRSASCSSTEGGQSRHNDEPVPSCVCAYLPSGVCQTWCAVPDRNSSATPSPRALLAGRDA